MISKNSSTQFLLFIFLMAVACNRKEENKHQKIDLATNWFIQHSDRINATGEVISTSGQTVVDWYKATVPSTIMGNLLANGLYPDIFVGENYKDMDKGLFDKSWWYRNEFALPQLRNDRRVTLRLDGVSYDANIWLNGKCIASRDSVYGAYRHFCFDITPYIQYHNVLAIEVFKAKAGDTNVGFACWNPRPADENMGLYRAVSLTITGSVTLKNTCVRSKVNTDTLDEAWLTVETDVENLTDRKVAANLTGTIGEGEFSYPVVLAPGEKRKVRITSAEEPMLHITQPRLWWCNNMGAPELYVLNMKLKVDNIVSDKENVTFGIRDVAPCLSEEDCKGFRLNGKNVWMKCAVWTDDIFLRDTPESNEIQIQYAKEMNLNMISLEGFRGSSSSIYDLCNKYGLMAVTGQSCGQKKNACCGKPCSDTFETGTGAQLPVVESILRFIPKDKLWPLNDTWRYHCTAPASTINALDELTTVINNTYGHAKDLNDFLMKANLVSYNAIRDMIEASKLNSRATTGGTQWMLNSAWPSLCRQMYDHYKVPTAAYYSAKKAHRPLHLIYNYANNSVYAVNELAEDVGRHKAIVQMFDMNSRRKEKKEIELDINGNTSVKIFEADALTELIFLALELVDTKGDTVADNFYCLSSTSGSFWEKSNFKNLSTLKPVAPGISVTKRKERDVMICTVEIDHAEPYIAFMVQLKLKDDKGQMIVPAFWTDNYISLLPGQSKRVECKVATDAINGKNLKIEVEGWNVALSEYALQ